MFANSRFPILILTLGLLLTLSTFLTVGCLGSSSADAPGSPVVDADSDENDDGDDERNIASEYVEVAIEEQMRAADILALLDRTTRSGSSSSEDSAFNQQLRRGIFLTATPRGPNIILKFEVNGGGTKPRETIAEVAISVERGSVFFELVESALTTAETAFSNTQFAAPWELMILAESEFGGEVEIKVAGDANAQFTLSWKIESPDRPIDSFIRPRAFRRPSQENIAGTVHFPITIEQFIQFVNRAYGSDAPERFTDFPLTPHEWLRLTVTGDAEETDEAEDRVVTVHFDAITTSGERLFVAEAPASTDVGQRFVDETVARMAEMLEEEEAQPSSSRKWKTDFFYDDPDKGAITVIVKGEGGRFEVAYRIETPSRKVRRP